MSTIENTGHRGVSYPEIRCSDRHLAVAEGISLGLSFCVRRVPVWASYVGIGNPTMPSILNCRITTLRSPPLSDTSPVSPDLRVAALRNQATHHTGAPPAPAPPQICPDSPSGTENIYKQLLKALTTTAENSFLPAIHAQEMAFVVPIHFTDLIPGERNRNDTSCSLVLRCLRLGLETIGPARRRMRRCGAHTDR